MRVLITGITGFIGGHLAERLLAEGVAVRGLARRSEAAAWLAKLGAEVLPGDLLEPASLARAVTGCDAVLHAAAWTGGAGLNSAQAWATNVTATGDLLQAAQVAGVQRFVYFSSVAVYGINHSLLIDETAPTPPVGDLYPDSKIAAEKLVREAQAAGLATTIIRPACTYGPRGTLSTVIPFQKVKAGRPQLLLLGWDEGLVNTGYIDNVVDGVLLALRSPAAIGETFNLCDGTTVTYRQFYERYATMLGQERLPTWPSWMAHAAATWPGNQLRRLLGRQPMSRWSYHIRFNPSRFSIEKAQRILGYEPQVDFDEGMRRTEVWLREVGYLVPHKSHEQWEG